MTGIPEFTVVDVETTGFSPERNDRIVEIALIRIDSRGVILDEYASLINPQRDLGPVHIHGITANEVEDAPLFEEVAGDILSMLAGAIFCAHNASFDLRFVRSEMARLGLSLPGLPVLCTMRLARIADPTVPVRRLPCLCRHFGIAHGRLHSARADAQATAELLAKCLSMIAERTEVSLQMLGIHDTPTGQQPWPVLPPSGKSHLRSDARRARPSKPHYIATLVAKLPALSSGDESLDDYLLVLDKALEDRRVTPEEAEELHNVARAAGLSREQAAKAHLTYMRDLVRVALADGIVTQFEAQDLEQVRALLNVSKVDYAMLLDEVKTEGTQDLDAAQSVPAQGQDIEGKTVCFTGQLLCRIGGKQATRSSAERIAAQNGMIVKQRVTKVLDYLVASDPDSMSGKATTARKYGVRILTEAVFWRMVGVQPE